MSLRDRLRKLSSGTDDLHRDHLTERWSHLDHGQVPIAESEPRQRVRLAGEITSMRVVPRAGSPSLEVTISDGTGYATAVFTGRQSIPGMRPGRNIAFEGVTRAERPGRVLLNPGYVLLP